MSREIKFRCWDKRLNKMYKVLSIKFDEPQWIYCEDSRFDHFSLKPDELEIMQFTGLKDKNGKEIYEEDIVVWSCFDGERYRVIYDRWGIPALAGVFNCEAYDFKELDMCHNATSNKCEVIGNIYENPELLK